MRQRWQWVGILAVGLFAINVIARIVVRLAAADNESRQVRIGFVAMGAVALVVGVAMFYLGHRYPMTRALGDLSIAVLAACLLSVLIGPFISGSGPFKDGAGAFFELIWQYLAFAIGGGVLGLIALVASGQDYRSLALKRYAERQRVKPRRP
jgi:hypothetical protein